jgi:hypothetical protein
MGDGLGSRNAAVVISATTDRLREEIHVLINFRTVLLWLA